MKKNSFRTLDLAVEFYELAQAVPISGNLKDQLHRAASSIALNLSEGNAKGSVNDKRRFFQAAYGSLRECQTVFQLAKVDDPTVHAAADKLGGSLWRLLNSEIKASPNWR